MKKVNFKNALMAFAVTLVFLLVGAGQAEAQSGTQLSGASGISFVGATEAQTILQDAIFQYKKDASNFPIGSTFHQAGYLIATYYDGILKELAFNGKSVQNAIKDGLVYVTSDISKAPLTKQQITQLMQGAINLLKI